MEKIQEGYERIQKEKRRLKHGHSSRNFMEFWDVFSLVAKDHAKTCPATPAYAPTGVGPWGIFNEWKNWKMADLDIFALGKTFQEIVSEKGRALREPFKSEFRMIQERLLHPDQLLQQAGLRLSGRPWNG